MADIFALIAAEEGSGSGGGVVHTPPFIDLGYRQTFGFNNDFARITNDGSRYIYSYASSNFYRYDTQTNSSWVALASPGSLNGPIVHVNGKIYLVTGEITGRLFIYTVSSNTWSAGVNTGQPTQGNMGASMVAIDSDTLIYTSGYGGGGVMSLRKYTISTGTWTELAGTNYMSQYITSSADMMYDGEDNIWYCPGYNDNPPAMGISVYSLKNNCWRTTITWYEIMGSSTAANMGYKPVFYTFPNSEYVYGILNNTYYCIFNKKTLIPVGAGMNGMLPSYGSSPLKVTTMGDRVFVIPISTTSGNKTGYIYTNDGIIS